MAARATPCLRAVLRVEFRNLKCVHANLQKLSAQNPFLRVASKYENMRELDLAREVLVGQAIRREIYEH